MKYVILLLSLAILPMPLAVAQSNLDDLETAIQGVVTVAVYKTEMLNRQMGARGANNIDEAYKKVLDLSGSSGSGSGFVVMKKGKPYVITNAHVVESASEEAQSLYVYTITRKKYEVKIVGGDTFYDIAVLAFVDQPGPEILPMKFRTTDVRVGEKVYAIGNPLGEYPYSVSDGIISAKNRTRNNQFVGRSGFLQSTATIIWGNSGGPLVDEKGLVVGINSQIQFASPNDQDFVIASQINFALEGKLSEKLADNIIQNGFLKRAYLGLELVQRLEYDQFYQPVLSAVLISGIIPDSPAQSAFAGKTGAELVALNDEKIDNLDHALEVLERIENGAKVRVTIRNKSGKEEVISLTTVDMVTRRFNDIAKYVLSKGAFRLQPTSNEGVVLAYKPGDMMQYNGDAGFTKPQGNSEENFYVVGAGMFEGSDQLIYSVKDLTDLGAIIRLSSLSGVIDLYTMPDKNGQDLQLHRHHLSGNEYIQQRTLYY